jgi:hypothetical protein
MCNDLAYIAANLIDNSNADVGIWKIMLYSTVASRFAVQSCNQKGSEAILYYT